MIEVMSATDSSPAIDVDQRIYLHGLRWEEFETLLEIRGDRSGVRFHYLDGELELMSPSRNHEWVKSLLGRLVEAYAEEAGLELCSFGAWTLKEEAKEVGAEPDESYVLGVRDVDRPDIAIEVIWTHGGLDKLEIYRSLGVGEVWIWQDHELTIWKLEREGYRQRAASHFLPGLDLALLLSYSERPDQTRAVREYRARLKELANGGDG